MLANKRTFCRRRFFASSEAWAALASAESRALTSSAFSVSSRFTTSLGSPTGTPTPPATVADNAAFSATSFSLSSRSLAFSKIRQQRFSRMTISLLKEHPFGRLLLLIFLFLQQENAQLTPSPASAYLAAFEVNLRRLTRLMHFGQIACHAPRWC